MVVDFLSGSRISVYVLKKRLIIIVKSLAYEKGPSTFNITYTIA